MIKSFSFIAVVTVITIFTCTFLGAQNQWSEGLQGDSAQLVSGLYLEAGTNFTILNPKAIGYLEKQNPTIGQSFALVENQCIVYYFKGGITICWDTYGHFVRYPGKETVAYGSGYKIQQVMAREGLTNDDFIRQTPQRECECTK